MAADGLLRAAPSDGDDLEGRYAADAWQAAELGVPVARGRGAVSFTQIGQAWLRAAAKRPLGLGAVSVRSFTRWVNAGPLQLPRELVGGGQPQAPSLDDTVAKFATIARPIANTIGFVTNVRVGALEVPHRLRVRFEQ
jgi:hypothetical protein